MNAPPHARCGLIGALLLAWTSPPAFAQPGAPLEVSVCDLVRAPADYDRKRIRVRATVNLAFENFTLDQVGCGSKETLTPVWLEYGGDEETATTYCCGDHSKERGTAPLIDGRPVQLVRDASLELFVSRLNARRQRLPDGGFCYGRECHFYDVTATLTGVFLNGTSPKDPSFGYGYGHLGCCHLLTIEKVSSVHAARTKAPAGGHYACPEDRMEAPPQVARRLVDGASACRNGDGACEVIWRGLVGLVAGAWGDRIAAPHHGSFKVWIEQGRWHGEWLSEDLLVTYRALLPPAAPASSEPVIVALERRRCHALTPPAPSNATVSCHSWRYGPILPNDTSRVKWSLEGAAADVVPALMAQAALGVAWPFGPDVAMKCSGVGAGVIPGLEFAICTAVSADGLQDATAVLVRKAGASGESTAPWTLTRGRITVCTATGVQ